MIICSCKETLKWKNEITHIEKALSIGNNMYAPNKHWLLLLSFFLRRNISKKMLAIIMCFYVPGTVLNA